MSETLRLALVAGAGPLVRRSLVLVPPEKLTESNPQIIANYANQIADICLQDAELLGGNLNAGHKAVVHALTSAACRAVGTHPIAMRAFARVYTAGYESDPAFTNPRTKEFPNALAGMGIEQRILHLRKASLEGTGETKRWNQLTLLLAILEGRVRPMLLSIDFLTRVLSGKHPEPKPGESLRTWHQETADCFYRMRLFHYEDANGKPAPRDEPVIKDFAESRNLLRKAANHSAFTVEESGALKRLQRMLRQETAPHGTPESGGGVNFEEVRHSIAHFNLSLEPDRVMLQRASATHTFLTGKDGAVLASMTDDQLSETTEEAWSLLVVSWAWQLVLNLLDLWLSGRVIRHFPYPQSDRDATTMDPDYCGRATTVIAALAATMAGS